MVIQIVKANIEPRTISAIDGWSYIPRLGKVLGGFGLLKATGDPMPDANLGLHFEKLAGAVKGLDAVEALKIEQKYRQNRADAQLECP